MTNNSRALAATVVGAVLGAMAGYLLFTNEGRVLRRRMEPALEDLAAELISFRRTVEKAVGVASEGWKLLNDTLGEGTPPSRYPHTHQTSPF